MEVKEFAEYLVKSIVKEPDMVKVQQFGGEEDSTILEIIVHEDDRGLVIGRNGKNLKALTIVTSQHILNELGKNFKFIIDINSYKEKREKSLEYLAKKVAREVANTKIEAKLDSMNSYERRIIHNTLTNNKKV